MQALQFFKMTLKWALGSLFIVQLCFGQAVHVHSLGPKFDKKIIKNSSYVVHDRDNRDFMTREKEFQLNLLKRANLESKFKGSDYWELEELMDLLESKSLSQVKKRFPQLTDQEARRLLSAYYE